ncbi:MAG: TolC family protein [Marinilabiliaceae bacterium]|nr:TolC family protein [Marinilabiliaceae bacterium]
MKRNIATVALMMVMTATSLFAQSQPAADASQKEMNLSLKDAVSSALSYSKQLQTSQQDVEIYKEKIIETRASGLPQVSASLTGTTFFGKEMSFGEMKMKRENQLMFAASASYTLSLQQLASVKVSKIAAQVYETTDESNILDVKANVTDTYYALLVYKRTIDILNQNLADMEDIQKHTQYAFDAGTCEQTDVDQIRVNVAQLKNTINSTERNYEVTKRLLVLQMGLPISTKINPTENLDDMIIEGTVAQMDSSNFDITKNPTYKQMAQSLDVSEATLKMYKRAYLPTLTVQYQYSHPFKGGFMNVDHTGNIVLSIPIFDGLAKQSRVKQAKLEVAKGQTNMDLLMDNLMQNEEQYRFELNSAIDAYLLQKENLDVAKRVLENYRNKYNQGVLSSLDLTQANANYLQAETSYATASLDLLQAHTKLSKLYNNFEY